MCKLPTKSLRIILLILSITLLLSGCLPVYTPPETGPVAYLKEAGFSQGPERGFIHIFDDPIRCIDLKRFSSVNYVKPDFVAIPALKFNTIRASFFNHDSVLFASFYAKANMYYEVNLRNQRIRILEAKNQEMTNASPTKFILREIPFFSNQCDDKKIQSIMLGVEHNREKFRFPMKRNSGL